MDKSTSQSPAGSPANASSSSPEKAPRKRGRRLPLKRGAVKAKKKVALKANGKPRKKKKKITDPDVKIRMKAVALRNLGLANPVLEEKLKREDRLKALSVQEQIAKKEANIAESKTIAEMRGEVERLCKKHDYSPLEELVLAAKKGKLKPAERISINKYLGNKMVPDVKAVDIQADMNMNVRVTLQSFADASVAAMKEAHKVVDEVLTDDDYAEFEEIDSDE